MGIIQRQGIKHTIVSYLSVVIGVFSLLFVYPLRTDLYGLFQTLYSGSIIMMSFFILGQNLIAVKFFPNFKDQKTGHNGFLSLILIVFCIGYLLFLCFFPLLKDFQVNYLFKDSQNPELFKEYIIYQIPLVFLLGLNTILIRYISNFNRIVVPNILDQVLIKLALPILILLVYFGYINIQTYVIGFTVNYLLVVVGMIIYTIYLGQFSIRFRNIKIEKKLAKEMANYSFFGLLNALGNQISFRIDTIMVSGLISLSSGGVYAIIFMLSDVIAKPAKAINTIASPIIAKAWNENNVAEIESIYKKSSSILLLGGGMIFLMIWLSFNDITQIMPNSEDIQANKLVVLFIGIGNLIDLSTSINTHIISFSKKYKFNFYTLILLAILTVIFNLLLIPKYQIIGAAIATFLSLLIYNSIKLIYIWLVFKMQPFSISTIKVLIIFAFCWISISLIPFVGNVYFIIILRSALLGLTYLGLAYYFKASIQFNEIVDSLYSKYISRNKN